MSLNRKAFMELALKISKNALPKCRPNPPVGCVLVRDGEIIATGYTREPGHAHAEADAISTIEGSLAGIEAYVTLEPCSFHNRTPSCAVTLAARGISTVYVAIEDPHPQNRGRGISILREAGVSVHTGLLADEVAEFISPYLIRE